MRDTKLLRKHNLVKAERLLYMVRFKNSKQFVQYIELAGCIQMHDFFAFGVYIAASFYLC